MLSSKSKINHFIANMQILCITVVTHETNCRRTDISAIAHVGATKDVKQKKCPQNSNKTKGGKEITCSDALGGAGTLILAAGIAVDGWIFFLSSNLFSETAA